MAINLVSSLYTITIKEIMLIISQVDYSSKWFFFRYVSFSEVLYMKTIKKIFKTQVKTVSIISWDVTFNCMELEKPWLRGHFTRWDFLSRIQVQHFNKLDLYRAKHDFAHPSFFSKYQQQYYTKFNL